MVWRMPPPLRCAAMKSSLACPKCSGRKLFHIPEVHQPPEDNGWENPTRPRALTAVVSRATPQFGRHDIVEAGPCKAVVCATCGFIEWYASPSALARLKALAREGTHVRVIQPPAQPPYR